MRYIRRLAIPLTAWVYVSGCGASPSTSGTVEPPATPSPTAASTTRPAPTPMRVGGDVTEPYELSRVAPDYSRIPDTARGLGHCLFEAVISTDGLVQDLRVLRPSTVSPRCKPAIDEYVRTISQWRYRPATYRGQPVATFLTISITHCSSCPGQ